MKQRMMLDHKNQQGSKYHLKNAISVVLRNPSSPSENTPSWKAQNTCVRLFVRHFHLYVAIEIGHPAKIYAKHVKY